MAQSTSPPLPVLYGIVGGSDHLLSGDLYVCMTCLFLKKSDTCENKTYT